MKGERIEWWWLLGGKIGGGRRNVSWCGREIGFFF